MPQTVINPSGLGGVPTDTSGVQRAAPTAVAGAGSTSPPVPVMGVDSCDARGSLTFGSGTSPGAGIYAVVTFTTPRDGSRAPVVAVSESTQAAAGIDWYVTQNTNAAGQITGFNIGANTRVPAASQANTTYGIAWILLD